MPRQRVRPAQLPELAVLAEEKGFDSVWIADHIAVPSANSQLYGSVMEPLVTLANIAAKTERLKIGTSVLILPQRNPLLVAKQAAALDILSQGRLILGVGAGWMEGEFDLIGADFRSRGEVFDESIQLMRAVWSEPVINFLGKHFIIKNAVSFPKPKRPIPIWIGGNSDVAIQRAARLGDGWHPISVRPSRVADGRKLLEQPGGGKARRGKRRSKTIAPRATVSITRGGEKRPQQALLSGTRQQVVQQVEEYEDAGAEYFLLESARAHDLASVTEDLTAFAREILSSF